MDNHERSIESLVGEQLSAVSFVQDYVEFHFDGPVIRALTNPIVDAPGGRWQFPGPGSRDALCSLIARLVERVEHEEEVHLRLDFGGGHALTVPLDSASYLSAEAMHFQSSPTAPLQVWN
jgi:hypothetical protein